MTEEAWSSALAAFNIEAEALRQSASRMDMRAFGEAVDALKNAPLIAASGCGHSGIACAHFAHLMCCIEKPARFIPPSEALHGGLGFLAKGSVLLLASRGGKTAELTPISEVGRARGAIVITVTENDASPLARNSDIVLLMLAERETDRENTQGTASFCAMNAIFDALQAALIVDMDYVSKRFAQIHPGGAVGKRLNSSV